MHDPEFGLGIDTRVHLWHPCKAEVAKTRHNGVDWVDITFWRRVDVAGGQRSTEQVIVQVRQGAAEDLLLRLQELFPPLESEEESCQPSATAEES